MATSSKSRVIVAGILAAGVSSAAVYLLYRRTSKFKSNEKDSIFSVPETEHESTLSSSATRSSDRNSLEDELSPEKHDNGQPSSSSIKEGHTGVTIVLSSALMKAFILARKAKSAGLNILFHDKYEDHNTSHGFDQDSSFAYGKYRYRSAQDLTSGRTYFLQKCASDMAVRCPKAESMSLRTPQTNSVPPLSEIFPLSVLRKAGVCQDPFFGDDDDSEDGSSQGFVTRTSSGKTVRYIKSGCHRVQQQVTALPVTVNELRNTDIVHIFRPEFNRVRKVGSEFDDMYNRLYNDYHAVVTPNPPVVLYESHSQ